MSGQARMLSEQLGDRIEALAQQLLPGGVLRNGKWRVGSVAGEAGQSLCLWFYGSKRGKWRDYGSGEGGDPLDLVAAAHCGGDLGDACKWARAWLGLGDLDPGEAERLKGEAEKSREARRKQQEREALNQAQDARRLWLEGAPLVPGDPAWCYLAGRGIDLARLPQVPGALRCHARLYNAESGLYWPALVAAICAPDGQHINTHRIWLHQQAAGKYVKAPISQPKLSMQGGYAGGCVRLWKGASAKPWNAMPAGERLAVGEGIEDTLSFVVTAPEWRACAVLSVSSFAGLVVPDQVEHLLWIGQNDPKGSPAQRALRHAVALHRATGRKVSILRPPVCFKDVNEYLQWLGRAPAEEELEGDA